ncbi:MAG TPA: autotransporter-associated beta strand repeat-containing protein, partial [Pirellulales bacterium]|nr:autotransporter-associated beta strand repeat-containing protein [Pirellulales bacterium]
SGAATSSALNKTQSGTLVLNGAATYAGSTTIGVAPNSSGGTIQLGVANALPTGTTVTFYDNGVSRSTLDLHGFSQSIAGINDGGNGSGLITNNGSGTPTLTLNNSTANSYYGQIAGSLALVKSGLGDLEIGGANSFTGGVTISGGKLRANNTSGSATGTGTVNVNNGGTLDGSGIVTGPANINAGGTIAPGNSSGSIALGTTTYNNGGTYQWEINNWTGTTRGTDFDFQNTIGTLAIASTPGTFPTNTFKIDITGLNGSTPGNIANFDPLHSRSWTIAEASTAVTGFAANKFTIDTSHVIDNLAGGTFGLSTANGAGTVQDLVLTFTPGATQQPVIGQIAATPANGSMITGGSMPFSITVQNAASAGAQDLNFSASAGTNVSGSIPGPVIVPAGSTSAPQSGLSFTGTAIGPNQTGQFAVSDSSATNSPQTGSVSVNVFDHASTGAFNGGSISLPSVIVGYSGSIAGASSLTVTNGNAADYRVNLKASGGTSNTVSVSGFGNIAPGSGGTISASLAAGRAVGPINETIPVTFADDSSLNGASGNLTTKNVTVTGNVYDHATPSNDTGAPAGFNGGTLDLGNIHLGYSSAIASAGALTVFNGSLGDNRVALAGSGAQTGGSTLGLSLNSIGGGGAIGAGGSAAISATLAPGLSAGAINQTFLYTFADDSALNGASTNVGAATISVTGNLYSGQSVWRGRQAFNGIQPQTTTNGTWGNISNWSGGAPGLDLNFATTDSATFGSQSGNVTVDLAGVRPSLHSLSFNQTGNYTIVDAAGTGSISLAGASPSLAAAGIHTIGVPLSLGAGTHIAITAGILRLNVGKTGGSVGTSVTVSIAQGATLELVGGVSALADGAGPSHRALISNDGTLTIGNPSITPSSEQQVGGIDGGGVTVVTDSTKLTADHIHQLSLVIGNDSIVTIAASDGSGNPLAAATSTNVSDQAWLSALLAATSPSQSPTQITNSSLAALSDSFGTTGLNSSSLTGLPAAGAAVPEPSSCLLIVVAAAGIVMAARRRGTG